MTKTLKPIHPGEILRMEYMTPYGLNPHSLAMRLHVPAPTVYDIVHERRGISPEIALRLRRCFGTTADFWLNLQTRFDLETAKDKKLRKVKQEVEPIAAAIT